MITLRENERLERRYIAKIKQENVGKGVLYYTNQRVCFESDKHGLVLELELGDLYNWGRDKKHLYIQYWKNEYEKDTIKIEIIEKFHGGIVSTFEVALSLYYRYVFFKKWGPKAEGFYLNNKQEPLTHFWDSILLPWNKVGRHYKISELPKHVNYDGMFYSKKDSVLFGQGNSTCIAWRRIIEQKILDKDNDEKIGVPRYGTYDYVLYEPLNIQDDGLLRFDIKKSVALSHARSADKLDKRLPSNKKCIKWIYCEPQKPSIEYAKEQLALRKLYNRPLVVMIEKVKENIKNGIDRKEKRTKSRDKFDMDNEQLRFPFKKHRSEEETLRDSRKWLRYQNRLYDIAEKEIEKGTITSEPGYFDYTKKLGHLMFEEWKKNTEIENWYPPKIKVDNLTNVEKAELKLSKIKVIEQI